MTEEVPFYRDVTTWLAGVVVTLIGVLWGVVNKRHEAANARIEALDARIDALAIGKMDREEADKRIEVLAQKTREDIINLHSKIDAGQKETRDRLDRILERLNG